MTKRRAPHRLSPEVSAYVANHIVPASRLPGRAICRCGTFSDILPDAPARRRWFREQHLPAVRTSIEGALQ